MSHTLKSQMAALYRGLLPAPLRDPMWHATRAAWAAIVLRNPREARGRFAEYLVSRNSFRSIVRLDEGFELTVDLRDEGVGRVIYRNRRYEPLETAFLKSYLLPGMTVVDVGANLGYYTILASRLVGNSGRIVAIEPDPDNFGLLQQNICGNGLGNVTALRLALGAESGNVTLHRSPANFGDHRVYSSDDNREMLEVELRRLDNVLAEVGVDQVDLLKMDVQGFEAGVIEGMCETLITRKVGSLLMEYWPHGIKRAGGDPTAMMSTLKDAGLNVHIFNRYGDLTCIDADNIDEHLPPFDPSEPDGCYLNCWLTSSLNVSSS